MPGEWLDAAEGRHCTATCAQEKKVIRVKLLGFVRVAMERAIRLEDRIEERRRYENKQLLEVLSLWHCGFFFWGVDLICIEKRGKNTRPVVKAIPLLRYNDAVGDEIAGFTFNEVVLIGLAVRCDSISWSTSIVDPWGVSVTSLQYLGLWSTRWPCTNEGCLHWMVHWCHPSHQAAGRKTKV